MLSEFRTPREPRRDAFIHEFAEFKRHFIDGGPDGAVTKDAFECALEKLCKHPESTEDLKQVKQIAVQLFSLCETASAALTSHPLDLSRTREGGRESLVTIDRRDGGVMTFAKRSLLTSATNPYSGNSISFASSAHSTTGPSTVQRTAVNDNDDSAPFFEMINEYCILKELGRGSQGKVFLAVHENTDAAVAIKTVSRPRLKQSPQRRAMMLPRFAEESGDDLDDEGIKSNNLSLSTAESQDKSPEEDKTVRPSFTETALSPSPPKKPEAALDAIDHEIQIMRNLRHQNLVQLVEVIEDPEEMAVHVVLEYCHKGPLVKVEPATPEGLVECSVVRPISRLREVAVGVVNGLLYLHRHRVVHGDLKPDNILVDEHDVVKIADFGSSGSLSSAVTGGAAFRAHAENPFHARGTPAFLAPELFEHYPAIGAPTMASDVWSLGVVLYAMLVGKLPFKGASAEDFSRSVRNAPLAFPPYEMLPEHETISDDEYSAWRSLLQCVLEKLPSDRMGLKRILKHPCITGVYSIAPRKLMKAGTDARLSVSEKSGSPSSEGEAQVTGAATFSAAPRTDVRITMFSAAKNKALSKKAKELTEHLHQ
jgi:serine/threonine protein kinase